MDLVKIGTVIVQKSLHGRPGGNIFNETLLPYEFQ